jgi:hypothetical protein
VLRQVETSQQPISPISKTGGPVKTSVAMQQTDFMFDKNGSHHPSLITHPLPAPPVLHCHPAVPFFQAALAVSKIPAGVFGHTGAEGSTHGFAV